MKSLLLVAKWCHSKLLSSKGYEYFLSREIRDEEIRVFGLGYFPERSEQELIQFVEANGGERQDLFKSGVIFDKSAGSSYYSMFQHRVIFPYANVYNEIIGFSGRSIDGRDPKYTNSIFNKISEPFNLQKAKFEAREKDIIFIVEGHICCITAWRNGVRNVIAGGGTAITQDHILKATRYAKTVCVIVDNDDAGLKAAEKILTFARDDYNLQVLSLPKQLSLESGTTEIKDLDDFFVKGRRNKDDFWNFYRESFRRVDSLQILRERANHLREV
jgi:DNA primase